MSQMNPIHTSTFYVPKINLTMSSSLRLCLPRGLLPSSFPIRILYVLLISPMLAKCSTHLILPDFIILMIFGEGYKLTRCKVCCLQNFYVQHFGKELKDIKFVVTFLI